MIWALSLMGFGSSDIAPESTLEKAYTILVTIMSLIGLAVLVSSVATAMYRLQSLNSKREEKEGRFRNYMSKYGVSLPLRDKIINFLRNVSHEQTSIASNAELLEILPAVTRLELRTEVMIPIVSAHPFFNSYITSTADKHAIIQLVRVDAMQETILAAEDDLFNEGEVATRFSFVVHGHVLYMSSAFDREVSMYKADGSRFQMLSDGRRQLAVGPGEWISEPAMWLKWTHMGRAVGEMPAGCGLVTVSAEKFQTTMQTELPLAKQYAVAFLKYAQQHRAQITDVWKELGCLRAMAKAVFEPGEMTFSIEQCRPVHISMVNRSDWKPTERQWQRLWRSPYKEEHIVKPSTMLCTMTTEMKYDVVLMYQTIFAQNSKPEPVHPELSEEEVRAHDLRVLFLKRLFLCFAVCGVTFSLEDNGTFLRPWPYPYGSTLCHGGRVVLTLEDIKWTELVNFLLHGTLTLLPTDWDDRAPPPFCVRWAATHGTVLRRQSGHINELRLSKTAAVRSSGHHLGMDIPVGGLGNPAPVQNSGEFFIGPAGVPFSRPKSRSNHLEFSKDIQHGHLYMRWDDHGDVNLTLVTDSSRSSTDQNEAIRDFKTSLNGIKSTIVFLKLINEENEKILLQTAATIFYGHAHYEATLNQIMCHTPTVRNKEQMRRFADAQVLTVFTSEHESWVASLSRYLQDDLGVSQRAVEMIIEGCTADTHNAYVSKVGQPMTLPRPENVPTQEDYVGLYLTFRIPKAHFQLFSPIMKEEHVSIESVRDLSTLPCFPSDQPQNGKIEREWCWRAPEDAEHLQAEGLEPRPGALRHCLRQGKKHISSLLIGIECSAPLKEDLFGSSHGASATSKELSAFGKRKWRDYRKGGLEVPADLGGLHSCVTPGRFRDLVQVCSELQLCKPSEGNVGDSRIQIREKRFFQLLLQSNDNEVAKIMKEHFRMDRGTDTACSSST